ncbi:hypothetical protein EGR_01925 [Echinococcus granulosus]|uniref:Uncharacterized protein n=1 Tax=Echinococcus granulosus TaxID=6210 RepID=W6UQZ8_ECHGR|nr:hypothetical protein EGR_01925 [Echinococcus granulosus]EUB63121.1 hypothetical protein EGR_01925 [Echinococcus granulosus]
MNFKIVFYLSKTPYGSHFAVARSEADRDLPHRRLSIHGAHHRCHSWSTKIKFCLFAKYDTFDYLEGGMTC